LSDQLKTETGSLD